MSQLEVDKIIPQSGTTLTIGDSGDTISFAEGTNLGIDTNTLVIDSTNNRVGIKNASPTVELDVTGSVAVSGTVTATSFVGDGSSLTGVSSVGGATGVDFNDNVKARFGTGNDLEIFHDGSNSNISDVGTGQLVLRTDGTQVAINKGSLENMAKFIVDGACELYHDNSKKFETTSTGVDVTGNMIADNVGIGQSVPSSDLHINRNGSDVGIRIQCADTTGTAKVQFGTQSDVVHTAIQFDASDNSLQFRGYNNSERMRIDNSGNIAIGLTNPSDYNGGFDNLVLGGTTGNHGVTIVSATTGDGTLAFADGTVSQDEYRGYIQYQHSTNKLNFGSNGSNRMHLDSSGHLLPETSNTYDLGSSSLVWRNIYTSDFHMSNEGLDKGNDIDGTKGSWTFQEGEENLYLINNKNGKKYKFNLTEIE